MLTKIKYSEAFFLHLFGIFSFSLKILETVFNLMVKVDFLGKIMQFVNVMCT
jgi:hypothetical protein